jgi:hypothetical protein
MQAVAAWVTEQDGFVGHIKASLAYTDNCSMSITLDTLTHIPGGASVKAEFAAIVFGVDQQALCRYVLAAFQSENE